MTPNVNIYGQPNTWLHVLPPSSYNTDNKNLIPAWQTIAGGISAGKVNYTQPLDNSICYAAIAEDAPAAGAYFAAGNNLNNPVENLPFKEDFFVSAGDYGSGLFNSIPYYDTTDNFPQKYTYDTTSSPVSNNPNMGLKPLCSASLKDIVLCIYVVGYNSDFTDYKISTYNGYKQQYSSSHPNITRIFGIPYARGENTNNRTALTNGEQYNFNGFCRMGENNIPNSANKYIDYFANICRDNYTDYQMTFNIWGIPESTGRIIFYSASSSYIYRAYGQGGKFEAHNGNLYYFRTWGAAYQQHSGDDWIRRAAASFGCFFTDRTSYAQTAAYASANMYLGTIDENGLCHGDYTTGADNTAQPQYNWLSTNESTYNPDIPIDDTIYNKTSTLNGQTIETFNTVYAITADTAHKLASVLSNAMASRPAGDTATDWALDTFLTNNPLDCIVSLKKFPCSVPISGGALTPIYFGSYYNATVQGFKMGTPYHVYTFSFSNADRNFLYPVYGDCFLDYEPYTHAELYIPFCGSVPISIADFMGHSLTVDFVVDFLTGACAAYIKKDGVYITSAQGNCALDIPVSGIQGATLDSQIFHAAQNAKSAHFNAAAASVGVLTSTVSGAANVSQGSLSAVTGGVNGFTSGLMRAENATIAKQTADYEQSHIQTPYKMVSGSSPLTSQICEYCCRLIIYRPKLMPTYNPEIYANTVGFACLINGKVKDFSGLTVGEINLDGVPCSAEEKQMIYNEFARGVIL